MFVDSALRLLNTILPMLYLASGAAYVTDFVRGEPAAVRLAKRLLEITLACHLAYLVLRTIHADHVPLSSPAELMTVVALATAAVYVVVERFTGVERTGAFMVLFSFVLQTLSSAFVTDSSAFPAVLRSPLFAVHTMAAVIGMAALGVSSVYGLLFLMLHHELKGGRFGMIYTRLPSLDTLARMNRRASAIGITFLTVTIVCGALWATRVFPGFMSDPKFLVTVVIWAVYLAVLLLHYVLHWNSRRTIVVSIAAFVLLLLSPLVTRLAPSFHVFK